MSLEYIKEYITDSMSAADLIEKLDPWLTIEELVDCLEPVLSTHYYKAFEEELEEYYESGY